MPVKGEKLGNPIINRKTNPMLQDTTYAVRAEVAAPSPNTLSVRLDNLLGRARTVRDAAQSVNGRLHGYPPPSTSAGNAKLERVSSSVSDYLSELGDILIDAEQAVMAAAERL